MDAHQSDDTGSDAELLDNWDVVDTDEAADASLYFSETEQKLEHKMSEEQVEEAPKLEEFVPQMYTPDDDSLIESEQLDKAGSESDDGVSVISDSCPEEEEVQLPPEECSAACEEQELLQLGEKGHPQYKHRPNPELNLLLNAILVVAVASVSGLAIGHFLGVQEECHAPPVVPEAWKEFDSLNLENNQLKMQLKQLQDSLVEKQSPWNEPEAPGNIYEEQMRPLEKWSARQDAAPERVVASEAAAINGSTAPSAPPPLPPPEEAAKPKRVDSFFGRVEAELEAVMRRVGGHGALQKTAGSVRQWAQQVGSQTATGSTYALEQLKKGVARAVHGLKKAAAHLNGRRNDTRPNKRPEWKHADKWRKQQQWRPKPQWRGDDDKWRLKRQQFQQQHHKNFKPHYYNNNKWRR